MKFKKKLKNNKDKKTESKQKAFSRLILLGKISQAMKYVDSENDTKGVHSLTDEIKQLLQQKHLQARDASDDIKLPQTENEPEQVIYCMKQLMRQQCIMLQNKFKVLAGQPYLMLMAGDTFNAPNYMEMHPQIFVRL